MSAYDDILAKIAVLSPVPKGSKRAVFVGVSAERSIVAAQVQRKAPGNALKVIEGLPVSVIGARDDLQGWAVMDCDRTGAWSDAPCDSPKTAA